MTIKTAKKDAKTRAIHRSKIIKGHISALVRMLEEGAYCIEILNQSLAIQKALQSLERLVLEKHLQGCVKKQMRSNESERAVKELISIYRLTQ